jgi:hypothetical protein
MSDVFVQGIRKKVRFQLPQGELTMEQLFDLKPIKSRTEKNEDGTAKVIDVLADYEAELQTEVESFAKVTRRGSSTRTTAQNLTQLKLSIVSAILDIRDSEAEEAATKAAVRAHNAEIDEQLAELDKRDRANLTREQLLALRK